MRNLLKTGFLLLIATAAAAAQSTRPITVEDNRAVVNEDRGKAFIVTPKTQPLTFAVKRRITIPAQYSIFLGNGWSDKSLHEQESPLADLFSTSDPTTIEVLEKKGVKNNFVANGSIEWTLDTGVRSLGDLAIQGIIDSVLKSGSVTSPIADTIIVVYIDPSLRSSMADLTPGKHYIAYHNGFYSSGTRVRYVVVPMEVNADDAAETALKAFLCAVLDPQSGM